MERAKALFAYLNETANRSFAWGSQDCALWAAGAVDAQRGSSIVASLGTTYDSAEGAEAFMDTRGWQTLGDAAREFLGDPLRRASYMRRGDLVHLPTAPRYFERWSRGALLICAGRDVLGPGPDGLVSIGLTAVLIQGAEAFRV